MIQQQIDFFELLKKNKENKPIEKETKNVDENTEEHEKQAGSKEKITKKTTSNKNKAQKTKTNEDTQKYKYPFNLYTEGRVVETNHIFETGIEYTESEITERMLQHRHYEFAGEMSYRMFEDDNTLVATARQHKKG